MTPDWLLEGPRGRRLCLEYVRAVADPEVGAEVIRASWRLESGPMVALSSSSGGAVEMPPALAPAALAAVVDSDETWRVSDPAQVTSALRMAVDTARYWQPPDGSDLLAADGALRPTIQEAAQLILSAAPPWWTEDASDAQWMIRFGDDAWASTDVTKAVRDACTQRALFERRAANDPQQHGDVDDAWSGFWWSNPRAPWSTRAVDGVPVGLTLVEDSLGWNEARTAPFPLAGRVCEIRRPQDWADLVHSHPQPARWSLRGDWGRTTASDLDWVLPDWAAIAADYEGVHVTTLAYLRTAGHALPLGDGTFTVLAGWAPDATYWLHNVHADETASQHWQLDASHAEFEWTRVH